jgi:protein-S-isoprenylcysteine O-methyltransferase Ste14
MNGFSIIFGAAPGGLWLAFMLLWLVWGAITNRQRPVVRRRRRGERAIWWAWIIVLLILLSFNSVFRSLLTAPILFWGTRLWPGYLLVAEAGFCLEVLGMSLAIWARYHLGHLWSSEVVLRKGHHVVDTGPYRLVRHPIYSGILLAMAGTFLMAGNILWLLILAGYAVYVGRKALNEERLLTRELGDEYVRYRSRTRMLIPWLL